MAIRDCPCGTKRPYPDCCGALHAGVREAATAEELMRSRYAAYVLKLPDYLVATTLPEARGPGLMAQLEAVLMRTTWQGLTVLARQAGGADDRTGQVEFQARYQVGTRSETHHERSQFQRLDGVWYYVDGDMLTG